MNEHKNIILLGPQGVGKTHLAISYGIKACLKEKRVQFYTAEKLVQTLASHELAGTLIAYLESMAKLDFLIIDEF